MRARTIGRASRAVVAAALLSLLPAATACAALPGTTVVACPSWVHFEAPADAVTDSDAVFTGTVAGPDGTARYMEVGMSAWTVDVDTVLAGDAVSDGDTVRVVSTADPCSGTAVYDDGDPLDAEGAELLVFVNDIGGTLFTLTPYQGVLKAPADGKIPAEWPAD
ncbi:UNVERIFIED_CONTAM: hypothetical protein OHV15_04740 [Microbacterium sp. SLM126]